MTETVLPDCKSLLPAGFSDVLPPLANLEASIVEKIITLWHSYGYDRVDPPLMEFEEGLLSGSGAASDVSRQTFRIMDPMSRRMLGIRSDITIQVARIAGSRLVNENRPLRLSYAGKILRVQGSQLRPARQFTQSGIELIGADCPKADAEVIILAAKALQNLGINDLCIDINMPQLIPSLFKDIDGCEHSVWADIRNSLNKKEPEVVDKLIAAGAKDEAKLVERLLAIPANADEAMEALRKIDLPEASKSEKERLFAVVGILQEKIPELSITIDAVENIGFEYHHGISFVIMKRSSTAVLGRGGRYIAGEDDKNSGEEATGVTLFLDSVMSLVKPEKQPDKIYIPADSGEELAEKLREEGWITVYALSEGGNVKKNAKERGCSHVLLAGKIITV